MARVSASSMSYRVLDVSLAMKEGENSVGIVPYACLAVFD